jgi:hypothetical protein
MMRAAEDRHAANREERKGMGCDEGTGPGDRDGDDRMQWQSDEAAAALFGTLPQEILCEIAVRCTARDAKALGAACCLLRCVVRGDDALWFGLFERWFGALYASMPQSVVGCFEDAVAHGSWPDFAAEALRSHGREPPPVPSPRLWSFGRPVPPPLVHLLGSGRDWRWMCIVHATRRECDWLYWPRYGHFAASGESAPVRRGGSRWRAGTRRARIGDTDRSGCLHGLGVEVEIGDDGAVSGWSVGAWDRGTASVWRATCSQGAYDEGSVGRLAVAIGRNGPHYHYSPSARTRLWSLHRPGAKHHIVLLATYREDAGPTIQRFLAVAPDGDSMVERMTTPVFDADFAYRLARNGGQRHGTATVRFRNGDAVAQTWMNGRLVDIGWFRCSDACPDPRFAGRRLGKGLAWHVLRFDSECGWKDGAYWLSGDSADAADFWRYVVAGHIGWSAETRQHALRFAPPDLVDPRCASTAPCRPAS